MLPQKQIHGEGTIKYTTKTTKTMKLEIFKADEQMETLLKTEISHMTMFDGSTINLHTRNIGSQMDIINVLIKAFVKFSIEGPCIFIDMKQHQRVKIRFDS